MPSLGSKMTPHRGHSFWNWPDWARGPKKSLQKGGNTHLSVRVDCLAYIHCEVGFFSPYL